MGEIPLMTTTGSFIINGTERVIVSPAAPLARRVLRARPRQDAFVRQAAVLGARHSLPRLLARLRVRPEGHRVLPRRPPPQDAGDDPAEGARLHARARSSRSSSTSTPSTSSRPASSSRWCPSACAARWRASTSTTSPARRIVAKDKRITVKHIRDMEAAGIKRISAPDDFILGRDARAQRGQHRHRRDHRQRQRRDHRDAARAAARGQGRQDPDAVHQRSRPGPVHLADAARRRDRRHERGARRDLPHDAPRRAADGRRGRGAVQRPVLRRGALRPLGGRPHEVQPPHRRARRDQLAAALPRHRAAEGGRGGAARVLQARARAVASAR